MAVKVTVSRTSVGKPTQTDTHEKGVSFLVRDGQLFVADGKHRDAHMIAAYAQGAWASAVVEG